MSAVLIRLRRPPSSMGGRGGRDSTFSIIAACINSLSINQTPGNLISLPGLDKIGEPSKEFGSVTVEDLVAGHKWSSKLNITDNTPESINPTNQDDFDNILGK
ncbi:hypothetical protein GTR04_5188 [Trichophyton interdigitale]|nr:hypothetical protein H101_01533 [Trichophyton interdigitale H6]KAG8207440.1 hypothetical protein GTR04_5188 [Trichophyton interdigitale]KDB21053.1 hypothetical protein H109_06997 [Trichophyton interdigitale MR816]